VDEIKVIENNVFCLLLGNAGKRGVKVRAQLGAKCTLMKL